MNSSLKSLSAASIGEAVKQAGLSPLTADLAEGFSAYFELLNRWNEKISLTAIREPSEILRRHFVECIFCAQVLPEEIRTLLDYGSGAGFPGIPIALCRPDIHVSLAECQGKKAGFLRETVRTLGLDAGVHGGRVEDMGKNLSFDAVTLRAVDRMQMAAREAAGKVAKNGYLVLMVGAGNVELPAGFTGQERRMPGAERRRLVLAHRQDVPRETSE